MPLVITMTIDIKTASCDDVSIENDVINLGGEGFSKNHDLAGANWIASASSPEEALSSVLQFVREAVFRSLPNYDLWALIGNSAWQPDTRVIRYKKLWRMLMEQGFDFSTLQPLPEILVERDGKLKFFGVFQFQNVSICSVAKMLLSEYCTYMVAIPSGLKIQDFLQTDWLMNVEDHGYFLSAVGNAGGVPIKVIGEFDDREHGLVAIGEVGLIRSLVS